MTQDKKQQQPQYHANRHNRRAANKVMKKKNADRVMTEEQAAKLNAKGGSQKKELINGYIDPLKKVSKSAKEYIDERIKQMHRKFDLPDRVSTERTPMRTKVKVINIPGKQRELLPDKKGCYKILCKGKLAKVMKSGVCMFVRITNAIDGSWAIVPAQVAMANVTTIQDVRKRSFSWLRRYSYEISFDGHVQPAHLFFDYGLRPDMKSMTFHVTREYVKVRGKNEDYNDYFRLWLDPECREPKPAGEDK